ncbi:MAG TPA: electron transfer flavoprotein subunit alpha/FixB family protein [Defluviitoga sp.]|nr:electron transfer flavoprotein subunit alpha/FixB family protein [Defluviitoga sp.]
MKQEHTGVWTISEIEDGTINPVSYELLAWGKGLAETLKVELTSIVLTNKIKDIESLIHYGADKVYYVENEKLEHFYPDTYTKILHQLVEEMKPEIILASATTKGRTLMPCLAARLRTGLTADCTDFEIEEETRSLIQIRPAIGGNVMAKIKTMTRPQMATVRPKSKQPLPKDETRRGEIIKKEFNEEMYQSRYEWINYKKDESIDQPIQQADVIIAGGKGLRRQENFKYLKEIAERLNGAVGATRAVVDMGWIDYSHQIGLSGKTVSPKLYIAVGISGAVQHIAGMSTSKYIISINKDPEAPIFKVSDLGIVGDATEIVPLLAKEIKQGDKK